MNIDDTLRIKKRVCYNKDNFMKHKLIALPTALEQAYKVVDEAKVDAIENDIDTLEQQKIERNQKQAFLPILNKTTQRKPLVKSVSLASETFREVLDTILSLQDTESFWAITLLYEYMEMKGKFKIDKLTGTELLKMSGYKQIPNQKQRDKILSRLLQHANTTVSVLDPERTSKNYKNKQTEEGMSYRNFVFLKIQRTNYSKKNPKLVVSLEGVELLPDYIDFLPVISRRYLPLEQIRKIPKRSPTDKARHFITKICLKFASIKGNSFSLNLEQCMNLGKFYNKSNLTAKRRIWKPIARALKLGLELQLLDFTWDFRKPSQKELKKDTLKLDDNGYIIPPKEKFIESLYKYIKSVTLVRVYELDYKIDLPFDLEKEKAVNPGAYQVKYY